MERLLELSGELLALGADGGDIPAGRLLRLDREVYGLAMEVYRGRGGGPREEALRCLSLLEAFAATAYDNGHKAEYAGKVLASALGLLPRLEDGPLKVRLLLACHREAGTPALLEEARRIARSWGGVRLAPGKRAVLEELARAEEALSLP